MTYPFLSEDWVAAVREVRAKYDDQSPIIPTSVKANLNITAVPFGDGTVSAHLDTSSGKMEMELGHLEGADATLTMDYGTAKSFVVDQDATAVMQAVLGGKVKIQGDMAKLMAMAAAGQSAGPELAIAQQISGEIKAMTE